MVRKSTIWSMLLSFLCTVIVTWCGIKFINSQFYLISPLYFICFSMIFESIYDCIKKYKNSILEIVVSIVGMLMATSLISVGNEYGNMPTDLCFYIFVGCLIFMFIVLVVNTGNDNNKE